MPIRDRFLYATAIAMGLCYSTHATAITGSNPCAYSVRTVVLDEATFHGNLNEALYFSHKGLQGMSGTILVPKGTWVQKSPVVMRTCQKLAGYGPDSRLVFTMTGPGYFISNTVKGTTEASTAESKNGRVTADGVVIQNLTITASSETPNSSAPLQRAIVFQGWPASESRGSGSSGYIVNHLLFQNLNIHALSGIAISFAKNAIIAHDSLLGVRDFSDRCLWKHDQHKLNAEAGILLSMGTTNSLISFSKVENFGAEGISIDIATTNRALIADAPTENIVEHNVIKSVGRSGIDVYGGNSNSFQDNIIINANMFHMRGGNSAYVRGGGANKFIRNAITGYGVLVSILGATDYFLMPSTGNVVRGNRLTYLGLGTGHASPKTHDCGMTENVPDYGAVLVGASDTEISYNIIRNDDNRVATPSIYVRSGSRQLITGNTIIGFNFPSEKTAAYIFDGPPGTDRPTTFRVVSNVCEHQSERHACDQQTR